jgi:ubiquinone/menaquinone biosynthesis C-methylase UbiE
MGNKKESSEFSGRLSKFYSTYIWPDDPLSEQGKQYFERAEKFMEKVIEHCWIKEIISKNKNLKILEICGGSGFGGVALSKVLKENGVNIELLITDLRKDALNIGKDWGSEILGKDVKFSPVDAREVHNLNEKFNIVLMYGLSAPHFSPWDIVKVISSVSETLTNDGIFLIDESDRRKRIFLDTGYKWSLGEGQIEDKFVASFHSGYDIIKGMFKRTYINFKNPTKPINLEVFMWGLAEIGAFLWTFFYNVDIIKLTGTRYFILGYKPGKILKPEKFKKPAVLNMNK